jgi:hypothetical protein
MTLLHIGHESPVPFPESHQDPVLFVNISNRHASFTPVLPGRPGQWIPNYFRCHFAYTLQVLQQGVLLGLKLTGTIEVLQGATSALTKMRAAGFNPVIRGLKNLNCFAFVVAAFAVCQPDHDPFAWQSAVDKYLFLTPGGNTASIVT